MIKKVFIFWFFVLNAMSAFAQAYDFTCEQGDPGLWYCDCMHRLSEKKFVEVHITSISNMSCILSMILSDYDNLFAHTIDEDRLGTVKIYLSNGEVLSTTQAHGGKKPWFHVGMHTLSSSKSGSSSTGGHAMELLRKYNITKINVNGNDFTTPDFRSAATIDAMCKTLIGKTGDQGQFGGGSSSANAKTTTPSPSVKKAAPAPPPLPECVRQYRNKQMTVMQMIDHPLGFLSPASKSFTYTNAMKQLDQCKVTADIKKENEYISLTAMECNYDLTWKGMHPFTVTAIWVNGELTSWNYVFYMDYDYKGKSLNDSYKVFLAEEIVNTLKSVKGVNFSKETPYQLEGRKYYRRGMYGDREVTVDLTEKDLRIRLEIEVSYLKTTMPKPKKLAETVAFNTTPRDLTMKEMITMPMGIVKSLTGNVRDIPFSKILSGAYSNRKWEQRKEKTIFWIPKGYDMTYHGKQISEATVWHRGESEDIYEHDWSSFGYSLRQPFTSKESHKAALTEVQNVYNMMVSDLNALGITMRTDTETKNQITSKGSDKNFDYTLTMRKSPFNKKQLSITGSSFLYVMLTVDKK